MQLTITNVTKSWEMAPSLGSFINLMEGVPQTGNWILIKNQLMEYKWKKTLNFFSFIPLIAE